MNQNEMIQNMSDKELTKAVVYSQILFINVKIILSFILFNKFSDWLHYFQLDIWEIFYYGIIPGMFIVFIDLIFMLILPAKYFDDGGINKRIFYNKSIGSIFILTLLIAIS